MPKQTPPEPAAKGNWHEGLETCFMSLHIDTVAFVYAPVFIFFGFFFSLSFCFSNSSVYYLGEKILFSVCTSDRTQTVDRLK